MSLHWTFKCHTVTVLSSLCACSLWNSLKRFEFKKNCHLFSLCRVFCFILKLLQSVTCSSAVPSLHFPSRKQERLSHHIHTHLFPLHCSPRYSPFTWKVHPQLLDPKTCKTIYHVRTNTELLQYQPANNNLSCVQFTEIQSLPLS